MFAEIEKMNSSRDIEKCINGSSVVKYLKIGTQKTVLVKKS